MGFGKKGKIVAKSKIVVKYAISGIWAFLQRFFPKKRKRKHAKRKKNENFELFICIYIFPVEKARLNDHPGWSLSAIFQ